MGGERAQGGGSERSKRSPGWGGWGGSSPGPAQALSRCCWGRGALFLHAPPQICPVPKRPGQALGTCAEIFDARIPPCGHKPSQGGSPAAPPTPPTRDVGAPRAHRSPPLLSAGLLGLPQPGVWIWGRRRPRRGAVRWEPGGVFWGALLPRVSLWDRRWLWGSIVLVLTEHEVFMNTLCPHPTSPCGAVS